MEVVVSLRLPLAAMCFALLAAACSSGEPSDTVTYKDPSELSLFAVPNDWHLYELDELAALDDLPFNETFQGLEFTTVNSVAFDGSPVRDVSNVTTPVATASFPIGSMSVRSVGNSERDFLSRVVLHQSVLPYYSFNEPDEVSKEDFSFGDGFDGVRVLVSFVADNNRDVGVAYLISVHDAEERRIYSMVAGCSYECFIANQEEIVKVVDSWLVNTKA